MLPVIWDCSNLAPVTAIYSYRPEFSGARAQFRPRDPSSLIRAPTCAGYEPTTEETVFFLVFFWDEIVPRLCMAPAATCTRLFYG